MRTIANDVSAMAHDTADAKPAIRAAPRHFATLSMGPSLHLEIAPSSIARKRCRRVGSGPARRPPPEAPREKPDVAPGVAPLHPATRKAPGDLRLDHRASVRVVRALADRTRRLRLGARAGAGLTTREPSSAFSDPPQAARLGGARPGERSRGGPGLRRIPRAAERVPGGCGAPATTRCCACPWRFARRSRRPASAACSSRASTSGSASMAT